VSTGEAPSDRPATLADYLRIMRRRKWIIALLPVTAALAAYVASASRVPVYRAAAEVLVLPTNIAAELQNLAPNLLLSDPNYLTTQAEIARSPELARRVAATAGVPGETPAEFLSQSTAISQAETNKVELSVSSGIGSDAVRLVNTYANEYTKYRGEVYERPIEKALRRNRAQIDAMRAQNPNQSNNQAFQARYQNLLQQRDNLQTFGQQIANNASVWSLATYAPKVSPRPRRAAILGGLLGLVLGVGLAFIADALDKRVRSEQEIEHILGIPLLGRVPRPTRRLRTDNKLVMLEEPTSVHAQTFRRLRTSLEFVNFEQRAEMIMVTSALPREGKSTTVSNLAVALARAGRDVAIADLDLRRPSLHTFFATGSDHGFTDVVVNRVPLERAIRQIALPSGGHLGSAPSANGRPTAARGNPTNGRASLESVLSVLPAGSIPPAADEFLESQGVSAVLAELSERHDVVLLDTPPLLAAGDVMTLSAKVDAIVVVTRLGIHRRQLEELARQLKNCRAPVLGFVVTGASHGDSYSYGYGYDQRLYEAPSEAERPRERT
jgi:Mrp family chromosome partitioning ATPase/capsular polysaccharide biosynthesis protein